jgi:hypothetical protein
MRPHSPAALPSSSSPSIPPAAPVSSMAQHEAAGAPEPSEVKVAELLSLGSRSTKRQAKRQTTATQQAEYSVVGDTATRTRVTRQAAGAPQHLPWLQAAVAILHLPWLHAAGATLRRRPSVRQGNNPGPISRATRPLAKMNFDVIITSIVSIEGYSYDALIVDDCTGFQWLYASVW